MDRLDWQKKAASISAGRELSGYDHPTEAIGPEPATATPDVRQVRAAAWNAHLAGLRASAEATAASAAASTAPPPGSMNWQTATGPPGSYPDRTSTRKRRRAYEHEDHHGTTSR